MSSPPINQQDYMNIMLQQEQKQLDSVMEPRRIALETEIRVLQAQRDALNSQIGQLETQHHQLHRQVQDEQTRLEMARNARLSAETILSNTMRQLADAQAALDRYSTSQADAQQQNKRSRIESDSDAGLTAQHAQPSTTQSTEEKKQRVMMLFDLIFDFLDMNDMFSMSRSFSTFRQKLDGNEYLCWQLKFQQMWPHTPLPRNLKKSFFFHNMKHFCVVYQAEKIARKQVESDCDSEDAQLLDAANRGARWNWCLDDQLKCLSEIYRTPSNHCADYKTIAGHIRRSELACRLQLSRLAMRKIVIQEEKESSRNLTGYKRKREEIKRNLEDFTGVEYMGAQNYINSDKPSHPHLKASDWSHPVHVRIFSRHHDEDEPNPYEFIIVLQSCNKYETLFQAITERIRDKPKYSWVKEGAPFCLGTDPGRKGNIDWSSVQSRHTFPIRNEHDWINHKDRVLVQVEQKKYVSFAEEK